MPFWSNKPLEITVDKNVSYILQKQQVYDNISKDLSRFDVDLTTNEVYTLQKKHISFIQTNYYVSKNLRLSYSPSLLQDYLHNSDFIILEILSQNVLVGIVIAKKIKIYINNCTLMSSDINFLCLVPKFRNLDLSGFIINKITLAVIVKWSDVNSAFYTTGYKIHPKFYSHKSIYHISINDKLLFNAGFRFQHPNLNFSHDFYNIKPFVPSVEFLNNIDTWNKHTYDISQSDLNPSSFFHFKDIDSNYICLYELHNVINNILVKSCYIYKTNFVSPDILKRFVIYFKLNPVFDLINTSLFFDSPLLLKGTGSLFYYSYNLKIPCTESNSLVTV
jgi:hypothetical protein